MERTLVIVKPDGVQRGLIGPIVTRLENRGLKIVGLKLMQVSERVQSTLRLSLILPLFQTFDSESAALAAFGEPGERSVAGRPFFMVICFAFLISRWALHFMQ